jgi:hypothetical protein
MVRTKTFCKVTDSDASPYIEQKDVILCRSGIQIYSYNEVKSALGEPLVKKDFYREYRPANVVVKAQDKCRNLPVTKEHPDVWVNPDNWDKLCGGIVGNEVSVVALEGEAEGEIGIKSDLTFYTRKLYDYYLENKEVSLGYTCKKHYVENPEEAGYDIILDEITEVNHLAITRAGRGGSSVAVIDSIIGGLRPMRTGIFAYLASKIVKDSKEPFSFGKEVLKAVKDSKGTTEEELAGEMKGVLDSMSVLKDCEAKDTLVDVVKDCFDNKEKAVAHEEELTKTLDTMWIDIHGDSLKEIAKAFAKLSETKPETTVATADTQTKDSETEKKDDEEAKADDSETEKKDDEEAKADDSETEKKDDESEEDKKGKDGCNKDSAPVMTKDDVLSAIKDALPEMVQNAVKEVLGIKETKSQINGGVVDSANLNGAVASRDYSSFLE